MVYEGSMEGHYVNLRSATEEDAAFTLEIRQQPDIVRYIPEIKNTQQQQAAWIRQQRKTEGDYFFVVESKDGQRLGTISIYHIQGLQAESGRLALRGDVFQNVEAEILLLDFAFDELKLQEVYGEIYTQNTRALRFSKQFGGIVQDAIGQLNGQPVYRLVHRKPGYTACRKKIAAVIYK